MLLASLVAVRRATARPTLPRVLAAAHLSTAPPPPSDDPPSTPSSWMPAWLRNRVPTTLGGAKEADLTLEEYAKTLARARTLGALTGFAGGTSDAANPGVRGALLQYEAVLAAITDEAHRRAPTSMSAADRAAVAERAGVSVAIVDDTLAKFARVKALGAELARRKAAGEALPTSVEELERAVGSVGAAAGVAAAPAPADGQTGVSADRVAPNGSPCPFRGLAPARNAVCPATKKKYKQCCFPGNKKVPYTQSPRPPPPPRFTGKSTAFHRPQSV